MPPDNQSPTEPTIGDAARAQLASLLALHARHASTLATLTKEQQAASAALGSKQQQARDVQAQAHQAKRQDADATLKRRTSQVQQARQQATDARATLSSATAALPSLPAATHPPAPGDYSSSLEQHVQALTRSANAAQTLAQQISEETQRLAQRRRNILFAAAALLVVVLAGVGWGAQQVRQQRIEQANATATVVAAQVQATATAVAVPTATAQAVAAQATAEARIAQEIAAGTMKVIPAGPFQMGCSPDDSQCSNDEQPLHTVTLDAYAIDTYETTNARYIACVDAGGCTPPQATASAIHDPYYGNPDFADYPVINVDWNQANAFCQWEGKRLPTEAEWEKAARGADDTRIFPWGNAAPNDTLLNFNSNVGDTTKVGSYSSGASPYGVMDLSGNVWEWVNDWYNDGYYSASPANNPQGPETGDARVLRGGSWGSGAKFARTSVRDGGFPHGSFDFIGFRCAHSQ